MNEDFDFMKKWSKIMPKNELADIEKAFQTGDYLTFLCDDRDEALKKMYYIFQNGPFIDPCLFCEYPEDYGLDPVPDLEEDDLSREELLILMASGDFHSCTLIGTTSDDGMLEAAVIWDDDEGLDSGWLYLFVYGDRPYTDIEIRLADMLNTPMYP